MHLSNSAILALFDQAYHIFRTNIKTLLLTDVIFVCTFTIMPITALYFIIAIVAIERPAFRELSDLFVANNLSYLYGAMIFQLRFIHLFIRKTIRNNVYEALDKPYLAENPPKHTGERNLQFIYLLQCIAISVLIKNVLVFVAPAQQIAAFVLIGLTFLALLVLCQFLAYWPLYQQKPLISTLFASIGLVFQSFRSSIIMFCLRCISLCLFLVWGGVLFAIAFSPTLDMWDSNPQAFLVLCILAQTIIVLGLVYSSVVQFLYFLKLQTQIEGYDLQERLSLMQQ
jgi:hypothetical protein